jgi:iron complex outermembrane receptor protein
MSARSVLAAAIAAALSSNAFAQQAEQDSLPQEAAPQNVEVIAVTGARRREEAAQDVPISISVVNGDYLQDSGAFNVSRLQNIEPTVQFYSSNPRNTFVNIRGLGQPYGLTNDGIEPGVGFYVDGVLYARPASTTMDFIDVERIEVLRGPQGTLFGKNTTAGAILVTTRKPSFEPEVDFEVSFGNDDFTQAKASFTGPFGERVAGRLSFSSTQRDGNLYNVLTDEKVNNLDNVGLRGQLLVRASEETDLLFALDYAEQSPVGYAQVLAGAVPTYRGTPGFVSALYDIAPNPSANEGRHFWGIIDDLGYTPPNADAAIREVRPFDRVIDTGTPWRSGNELGGVSFNLDTEVAGGTLTATTAWRYWVWDPSNDRDYLALLVGTLSQAPSEHEQWTQEVRWAGEFSPNVSAVFGFFAFDQRLETNPVHTEQVGADYFRFVWNPSPAPNGNPSLAVWGPGGTGYVPAFPGQANYFDGQRSEITSRLDTVSAALFSQLDWSITERVHLLPGLRVNYDRKEVDFRQRVLNVPELTADAPTPPAAAYSNQTALRDEKDDNVSGQLTLAFNADGGVNYYGTVATAFKSIGVNLGGGPAIDVPPEDVTHVELGLKSTSARGNTANLAVFETVVQDFQTQVLVPGNARPVIASAEEIRVRGVEFDGSVRIGNSVTLHGAIAYSDGEYTSFANAPVPLELTGYTSGGLPQVDATGGRLPGVSEWAASFGGEYYRQLRLFGASGEFFTGFDVYYRDDFSSSSTPSEFLNIEAYSLTNLRFGYRADSGWSGYLWVRNALDEEYFELVQAAPAGQGAGHYGAQLGDPRYYGATLRFEF